MCSGGFAGSHATFFMIPVDDRTSATLSVMKDYIEPGTTIISDCWKAYYCLASEGNKHFKVNHKVNFVDPDNCAHTNRIERHWRDAKNLVPKYGCTKAHFVGYLAVAYFKLHFPDVNSRLHYFLKAAADFYLPAA